MEPITLCGAVIVAFGLWIEFESTVKMLVSAVCKSKIIKKIMTLITAEQKPVYANRYAPYSR